MAISTAPAQSLTPLALPYEVPCNVDGAIAYETHVNVKTDPQACLANCLAFKAGMVTYDAQTGVCKAKQGWFARMPMKVNFDK